MKNKYGKNKIDRNWTKIKEIYNINLLSISNKYFTIRELDKVRDDIYIVAPDSTFTSKDGKWLIIKPENLKEEEKPFFVFTSKPFIIHGVGIDNISGYVLAFKLWKEEDKKRIKKFAKSYDDISLLNKVEWKPLIEKKKAFLYQV